MARERRTGTAARWALAVGLLALTPAVTRVASATAVEPTIVVHRAAVPGQPLEVTGTGWSGPVTVSLDHSTVTDTQPVSGRAFTASLKMPINIAYGSHTVWACQGCNPVEDGTYVGLDITVLPTLSLAADSGPVSSVLQVSGAGWNPAVGTVEIARVVNGGNESTLQRTTPGPDGSLAAAVSLPPETQPSTIFVVGAYQVKGAHVRGWVEPTASFTVVVDRTSSSSSITPSSGAISTSVTTGRGHGTTTRSGHPLARWPAAGWTLITAVVALAVLTAASLAHRRRPSRRGHAEPQVRVRSGQDGRARLREPPARPEWQVHIDSDSQTEPAYGQEKRS